MGFQPRNDHNKKQTCLAHADFHSSTVEYILAENRPSCKQWNISWLRTAHHVNSDLWIWNRLPNWKYFPLNKNFRKLNGNSRYYYTKESGFY